MPLILNKFNHFIKYSFLVAKFLICAFFYSITHRLERALQISIGFRKNPTDDSAGPYVNVYIEESDKVEALFVYA